MLSMGDREARFRGKQRADQSPDYCFYHHYFFYSRGFLRYYWLGGTGYSHFCRMIVGPDHKVLIPATMLVGQAI